LYEYTKASYRGLINLYDILSYFIFKTCPILRVEPVEELKKTGNGLKDWMNYMWDHTTLIEKDDPQLETFKYMEELGLCHLRVMDKIGAESAAKLVYDKFNDIMSKTGGGRVKVVKVECWENKSNSSIYQE